VPVDHDPFATTPTDALPHIIGHPESPNAPQDNPAGADGPDDWFVPTDDGYPDDWFVPAPPAAPRKLRTTAVLSADGDTIVAGGKRDLEPSQRSLIRPGERPAKFPGAHAETTVLLEALNAGLLPRALATTRTICADCAGTIEDLGGVLTSKTTAVFPR
jgi:hypothetical protein